MDIAVKPVKEFAKDSYRLVKRCTKPDRKGALLRGALVPQLQPVRWSHSQNSALVARAQLAQVAHAQPCHGCAPRGTQPDYAAPRCAAPLSGARHARLEA